MPKSVSEFRCMADTFGTAKAAAQLGWAASPDCAASQERKGKLKLNRDHSGEYPLNFKIESVGSSRRNIFGKTWNRLADTLWRPISRERKHLYDWRTMCDWIETELTCIPPKEPSEPADRLPKNVLQHIFATLWPQGNYLSATSFTHLGMDSAKHRQSFDAWLKCPSKAGPINHRNIDRKKTRIVDDQLFLVFNAGGVDLEFRLRCKTGGQIDADRSERDLQRLYRIATDKHATYENLAELVTGFLGDTVEEEAPALIQNHVLKHFTDRPQAVRASGGDSSVTERRPHEHFIARRPDGKLSSGSRRALDEAIIRSMSSMKAWACGEKAKIIATANTLRTHPESAGIVQKFWASVERVRGAQQDLDQADKKGTGLIFGRRLDTSAPLRSDVVQQLAITENAARKIVKGEDVPDVAVISYNKPPTLWQRLLAKIGFAPRIEREAVAVACYSDGGLGFPVAASPYHSSFWRALSIKKEPENFTELIQTLSRSHLDKSWRDNAMQFYTHLTQTESRCEDVTLKALLWSVRHGKSTFVDYAHASEHCNDTYDPHPFGAEAGHDRTTASGTRGTVSPAPAEGSGSTARKPAATIMQASSPMEALFNVLFQRVRGDAPQRGTAAEVAPGQRIYYPSMGADGSIRLYNSIRSQNGGETGLTQVGADAASRTTSSGSPSSGSAAVVSVPAGGSPDASAITESPLGAGAHGGSDGVSTTGRTVIEPHAEVQVATV